MKKNAIFPTPQLLKLHGSAALLFLALGSVAFSEPLPGAPVPRPLPREEAARIAKEKAQLDAEVQARQKSLEAARLAVLESIKKNNILDTSAQAGAGDPSRSDYVKSMAVFDAALSALEKARGAIFQKRYDSVKEGVARVVRQEIETQTKEAEANRINVAKFARENGIVDNGDGKSVQITTEMQNPTKTADAAASFQARKLAYRQLKSLRNVDLAAINSLRELDVAKRLAELPPNDPAELQRLVENQEAKVRTIQGFLNALAGKYGIKDAAEVGADPTISGPAGGPPMDPAAAKSRVTEYLRTKQDLEDSTATLAVMKSAVASKVEAKK